MAPPRPYWKGYLKLSLVSCPVALYSSTASGERVAFKQINKRTGNRLRQQLVDDATREPVEAQDKVRGYEISKNTFMIVEDDELDAVAVEANHTIGIDSFVPRAEIDERYLESPYYLVPNDQVGQEAFAVIREVMRTKGMVALGRVVLAKRERVIMLQPWDKGLLGITLRYAYEVRAPQDYFGDIPDLTIQKDLLDLAQHIVDQKTTRFDPTQFRDHYEEAVVEMLRQKQAGAPTPAATVAAAPHNVVNLFEALRRSLDQAAPTAGAAAPAVEAPRKAKKPPKKAAAGQREMLLPIAGSKASKAAAGAEPAKAPAKPAARSTRKAG